MKPTFAFEKKYLVIIGIAFSVSSLPVIALAQTLDLGKSYFNITKGAAGGTIETGDVLEIRATITVKSATFDSCSYSDLIPTGASFIPGSIRVLTNEGKIYKQFTDVFDDDCGWINGSVVRINLGYSSVNPATAYRRGRVASTHKPSLYGTSCIMLASYRVTVNAAINNTLNLGGGWFTYQSGLEPVQLILFPANMVKVYPNNAIGTTVSGTNMFTAESFGTFGTGKSRNRGTSALMSPAFSLQPLDIATPFDMSYAIVNNTSTRSNYTTTNSWAKPDNSSPTHRVFGKWDIIGDHTNASTVYGNAAADTVATNNSGYMLVVNGAYRNDSILQRTVTGLCPGTVYEITAWFRNLCSKCGCDSNGTGATVSTGPPYYITTGPGDSSGVHPNIAFEINGVDHYSTGNIPYTGAWVKKGFTYLTGTSQTSLTLRFSNNTTGGGGNDWAMDDISVASIGPVMTYSPATITAVCSGNPIMLHDTLRSGFNNYTYYQWQRSTNKGASWLDITPVTGPATPVQIGATWEYVASYQVPPSDTEPEDSADQYRVVVASSATNLSGPSCRFADPSNWITLQVLECGIALENQLLSFSGSVVDRKAVLQWLVSETDPCIYIIERSVNGIDYNPIAQVSSRNNGAPSNEYTYNDPLQPGDNFYYRIQILKPGGHANFSRVLRLALEGIGVFFVRVVNPFASQLPFDVHTGNKATALVSLINAGGVIVQQREFRLQAGNNHLQLDNVSSLPSGLYFLVCRVGNEMLKTTLFKQNTNPH